MIRGHLLVISAALLFATFEADALAADLGIGIPIYLACPKGQQCCNGKCCTWKATCTREGCMLYSTMNVSSTQTTSACQTCDPMTLAITADDELLKVYVDGVSYPIPSPALGWGLAKFIPIPAASKVIAVKSQDVAQVVASNLASVNNDYLLSDVSWKCKATYSTNWMTTNFNDASWQPAVASEINNAGFIHGTIAGISTNAWWIWTANNGYGFTPIDNVTYCRGYFPKNSCDHNYGNCGNLCAAEKKTCCNCQMLNDGPTKVCSCCPLGYVCCGPSGRRQTYGCCPANSKCSKDGASCLVTITSQAVYTGDCGLPIEKMP